MSESTFRTARTSFKHPSEAMGTPAPHAIGARSAPTNIRCASAHVGHRPSRQPRTRMPPVYRRRSHLSRSAPTIVRCRQKADLHLPDPVSNAARKTSGLVLLTVSYGGRPHHASVISVKCVGVDDGEYSCIHIAAYDRDAPTTATYIEVRCLGSKAILVERLGILNMNLKHAGRVARPDATMFDAKGTSAGSTGDLNRCRLPKQRKPHVLAVATAGNEHCYLPVSSDT